MRKCFPIDTDLIIKIIKIVKHLYLLLYAFFLFIQTAYAQEFSTKFYSNKHKDLITNDSACFAFFGYAGAPDVPQYCALKFGDDYKKLYLEFYKYDYQNKTLVSEKSFEISEGLFGDFMEILKKEILTAKSLPPRAVLDGINIEAGIKNDNKWFFAGTNTLDEKSLAYSLGRIVKSANIEEVESRLRTVQEIQDARFDNRKTIYAPQGFLFSDLPTISPNVCLTENYIWVIKHAYNKNINNDSKIILYRQTKNFSKLQETQLELPIAPHSQVQNLHALSNDSIVFSFAANNKYSIYKFDVKSEKISKICEKLNMVRQIKVLNKKEFLLVEEGYNKTSIHIFSDDGKKLFSYDEKQIDDSSLIFSNIILLKNGDIAASLTATTANNKDKKASCAFNRIAAMTFKIAVCVFDKELKLKSKSQFVEGDAKALCEIDNKIYLFAKQGALLSAQSTFSIYSLFSQELSKIGEFKTGVWVSNFQVKYADAILVFPPFESNSHEFTTGMFLKNGIVSSKKLDAEFNHIDSCAQDEKTIYLIKDNKFEYGTKNKFYVYKAEF